MGLSTEDLAKLQLEIAKVLLASSLGFIRNTAQILQGLTSLLLASYVAIFVGIVKQQSTPPLKLALPVYLVPVLLFVLSLASSLIAAALYPGYHITVGSLNSVLQGYDNAIRIRRQQLILPSVLTLLGIGASGTNAYFLYFF